MALYLDGRYFYRGSISLQQSFPKQLSLTQPNLLSCIQRYLEMENNPSRHKRSSGCVQCEVPYI